jgi:hypothetical protein
MILIRNQKKKWGHESKHILPLKKSPHSNQRGEMSEKNEPILGFSRENLIIGSPNII